MCAFLCTSSYMYSSDPSCKSQKYSYNFNLFSYLFHQLLQRPYDLTCVRVSIRLHACSNKTRDFFNVTFVNWLSTNSSTAAKIYTFQVVVQQQKPIQPMLLYGYGTSSILSNIKNGTGNIAGTLDDFGSGFQPMRAKTCTGKVNETSDFATILICHQL